MIDSPFDRRDFLRTTAGTLALLLSDRGLAAGQTATDVAIAGPPVRIGVIGVGVWGREILTTLGRMPSAQVVTVCDVYEPFLRRAAGGAPQATGVADYRRVLDNRDVEAVIVATPTHTHRDVACAALQAGKHVYCEAPLAAATADARQIAQTALAAPKQVFQAGLQGRSNSLYAHVAQFVKSGVLGDVTLVNAQWNRRDSWRRAAPTPERTEAVNWRLAADSAGLIGEIGIHQLDLMRMYLDAHPTSFTGWGSVAAWRDGRTIADTITCVIEVGAIRATYRATLGSSFGGAYTVFQGTNAALLMKESRSWLVKEADSPLLGWEVYARKETVHDDSGIAMVADATKLLKAGKEPGKDGGLEPEKPPLLLALEHFTRSIREGGPPACGAREGYAATVGALKANEAVSTGGRIDVPPRDYDIT
jgi:predicted dehydrogenase